MPRKRARDYSNLDGLVGERLDARIREPVRNCYRDWPVFVNRHLLDLFDGRPVLSRADLLTAGVRTHSAMDGERPLVIAEVVGNHIGWGVRLGILAQEQGTDGQPCWRLTSTEMLWAMVGRSALQVRGLSPERQAAVDRKIARSTAGKARYALRYAREVTRPMTADVLTRLLRDDPDFLIPDKWAPYVDDISTRWPRVAESYGLILDLPLGWTKERQDQWRQVLGLTWFEAVLTTRAQTSHDLTPDDIAALSQV